MAPPLPTAPSFGPQSFTDLEDAVLTLEVLRQLQVDDEITHFVCDVVVRRVGSGHIQDVPAGQKRNFTFSCLLTQNKMYRDVQMLK